MCTLLCSVRKLPMLPVLCREPKAKRGSLVPAKWVSQSSYIEISLFDFSLGVDLQNSYHAAFCSLIYLRQNHSVSPQHSSVFFTSVYGSSHWGLLCELRSSVIGEYCCKCFQMNCFTWKECEKLIGILRAHNWLASKDFYFQVIPVLHLFHFLLKFLSEFIFQFVLRKPTPHKASFSFSSQRRFLPPPKQSQLTKKPLPKPSQYKAEVSPWVWCLSEGNRRMLLFHLWVMSFSHLRWQGQQWWVFIMIYICAGGDHSLILAWGAAFPGLYTFIIDFVLWIATRSYVKGSCQVN